MIDKRLRDLFWLAVLCLILAAWGWDRGRLAARLEAMTAQPMTPAMGGMMSNGMGGVSAF